MAVARFAVVIGQVYPATLRGIITALIEPLKSGQPNVRAACASAAAALCPGLRSGLDMDTDGGLVDSLVDALLFAVQEQKTETLV
jgi:hypothetical protein